MLQFRAIFFLLLVLVLTVAPAVAAFQGVGESNEIGCSDSCCGSVPGDTDAEKEANGLCNPFQCHTCCFMTVPSFAIENTLLARSLAKIRVPHTGSYWFCVLHDVWQPPRRMA